MTDVKVSSDTAAYINPVARGTSPAQPPQAPQRQELPEDYRARVRDLEARIAAKERELSTTTNSRSAKYLRSDINKLKSRLATVNFYVDRYEEGRGSEDEVRRALLGKTVNRPQTGYEAAAEMGVTGKTEAATGTPVTGRERAAEEARIMRGTGHAGQVKDPWTRTTRAERAQPLYAVKTSGGTVYINQGVYDKLRAEERARARPVKEPWTRQTRAERAGPLYELRTPGGSVFVGQKVYAKLREEERKGATLFPEKQDAPSTLRLFDFDTGVKIQTSSSLEAKGREQWTTGHPVAGAYTYTLAAGTSVFEGATAIFTASPKETAKGLFNMFSEETSNQFYTGLKTTPVTAVGNLAGGFLLGKGVSKVGSNIRPSVSTKGIRTGEVLEAETRFYPRGTSQLVEGTATTPALTSVGRTVTRSVETPTNIFSRLTQDTVKVTTVEYELGGISRTSKLGAFKTVTTQAADSPKSVTKTYIGNQQVWTRDTPLLSRASPVFISKGVGVVERIPTQQLSPAVIQQQIRYNRYGAIQNDEFAGLTRQSSETTAISSVEPSKEIATLTKTEIIGGQARIADVSVSKAVPRPATITIGENAAAQAFLETTNRPVTAFQAAQPLNIQRGVTRKSTPVSVVKYSLQSSTKIAARKKPLLYRLRSPRGLIYSNLPLVELEKPSTIAFSELGAIKPGEAKPFILAKNPETVNLAGFTKTHATTETSEKAMFTPVRENRVTVVPETENRIKPEITRVTQPAINTRAEAKPRERTENYQAPTTRNVQETRNVQKARQVQEMRQVQETRQIQRAGVLGRIATPGAPLKVSEVKPPKTPYARAAAKEDKARFNVFVRRGGKFSRINNRPLTAEEAVTKGRRRVEKTLAASFKVTSTEGEPLTSPILPSSFTRSKRDRAVFVQRPGARLSGFGEREEIRLSKKRRWV